MQEVAYFIVNGTVIGCPVDSWECKLREKQGCQRVANADGDPLETAVPKTKPRAKKKVEENTEEAA